MNLIEQEAVLIKRLMKIQALEQEVRKMLASVRGGKKVEIRVIEERPDLIEMKDETA